MGNLTKFNIRYSNKKDHIYEFIESKLLSRDFYYNDTEYTKWYDYERDILLISKEFPDVFITVNGHGEEEDDIWIQYFYNGKSTPKYYAEIIYRKYDPKELK